jgi:predicted DsbA family dithiol-disulfide isomerase
MTDTISMTIYSDALCVWAYIAQPRVTELKRRFAGKISIRYRFCSVFGDTAQKIGEGWLDRGGYSAYGNHVRAMAAPFEHVKIHPDLWGRNQPASSMPAHLVLKAVQIIDDEHCEPVLCEIRKAFFESCLDVASWLVLESCLESAGVSSAAVREKLDSGQPHAALETDNADRQTLMVQGSPTFILNEGRQKLYGNVGYRVMEANINELLEEPNAGAASWC